jgi:glutamine synthetase
MEGENLLEPGKSPHQNLRFLLVLMAVLKGVHKHAGLLRAGIASAGNDHRLGANEAPPAIISVFLGEQLSKILDAIEAGTVSNMSAEQAVLKLGVGKLPEVSRDNTDRNRTSPFAFTGNKFEFRAVGSSASTAFPVTLVNAAVADGFSEITESLKAKLKTSKTQEAAVLEVIREATQETRAIRFEGNGYSEEWVKEAAKRGLLNLRKTPEALAELVSEKSRKTLAALGVFSEAELVSRFHVRVERYVKNLLIEVETLRAMVDTQVLPACFAYHSSLAQGLAAAKAAGIAVPSAQIADKTVGLIDSLQTKRAALEKAFHKVESLPQEDQKASSLCNEVAPLMMEVRSLCDELESIVADDYWPLPKYREMLFLA